MLFRSRHLRTTTKRKSRKGSDASGRSGTAGRTRKGQSARGRKKGGGLPRFSRKKGEPRHTGGSRVTTLIGRKLKGPRTRRASMTRQSYKMPRLRSRIGKSSYLHTDRKNVV